MIIVGKKYKFLDSEIEKLSNKFNIEFIEELDEENIIENINKKNPKLLVLNLSLSRSQKLIEFLSNQKLKHTEILTIESFLEKYLQKIFIPETPDELIPLEIKPFNKFQYFQKRIVDFAVSVPLLIFSMPILLYSVYRIKKESPDGPILFKQKRVGKDRKEFVCYKFRSMVPDAEKGKPQFASEDDPRVFKYGAFMRKTRIDEIPQIINVLKGEMHLIGPRPERKYWIEIFEKEIPYYNERHLISPGITGWAQVNYPYGSVVEDARQKLMYDLYYIKNWSIWLEIKTIFKTIKVMIGRKGI